MGMLAPSDEKPRNYFGRDRLRAASDKLVILFAVSRNEITSTYTIRIRWLFVWLAGISVVAFLSQLPGLQAPLPAHITNRTRRSITTLTNSASKPRPDFGRHIGRMGPLETN